jgi:hypothetical protein
LIKLDPEEAKKIAKKGYEEMTDVRSNILQDSGESSQG